MKTKLSNFRISHEFDNLLEVMWRIKKYRDKGINSKSDLWRYGVLKTLESENKGILEHLKEIKEINNYLNPYKVKSNSGKRMKDRVLEYFKNNYEKS